MRLSDEKAFFKFLLWKHCHKDFKIFLQDYGGRISKMFFNFSICFKKFLLKASFTGASIEFCSILCQQER